MAGPIQIYRGTVLPQQQSQAQDYDPQKGWTYYYDYEGLSESQMIALQNDFIAQGIACKMEYRNTGKSTLMVMDSTQNFTIDSWEIVANNEEPDLLNNPAFQALVAGVLQPGDTVFNVVAAMRYYLDLNTAPDGTNGAFTTPPNPPPSGTTGPTNLVPYAGTVVEIYYQIFQGGGTNYRRSNYVLRHKTNVSNRWNGASPGLNPNIADLFVDNIYSPAQLMTEVTSPALWAYPLPPRLQTKLLAIVPPVTLSSGDFQSGLILYEWGWLKGGSTENSAANNRVDIQTEYTLYLWPVAVYTPHP